MKIKHFIFLLLHNLLLYIHLSPSLHFSQAPCLFSSLLSLDSSQKMLTNFKIPFKMEGCMNKEAITKTTYASSKKGLMVAGLQSLLLEGDISNVVTKSALKTHRLQVQASSIEYCYLKSCYLCNKILSLDKDVYMYRGDQGFCSIECRNRQIVLDEMRELEASGKERLKSYEHCSTTAGRHETRRVLEELRRSHKPLPHENHWTIAS
ncbi:uncharacterized protein LOC133702399 [Populus nigra]|uniref:uncharacterized protein LOC133702399 n=1 Tax=Populus nigra TaxID=3691 RepID=UPI002B27A22D|nr:uncharacterized protein LOC133702399 [Populus nigra]